MTKLFVYGTLIDERRRELVLNGSARIISETPAFCEGKLYTTYTKAFPILIKRKEGSKRDRMPNAVYGTLLELEPAITEKAMWDRLDAYEGCSLTRVGRNMPYDLYKRIPICVSTIKFDDFDSFMEFKFDIVQRLSDVYVYVGNIRNPTVAKIEKTFQLRAGCMWHSFADKYGEGSEAYKKLFKESE